MAESLLDNKLFSSQAFFQFVSLGCDRLQFIVAFLKKNGISPTIINIGEHRHVAISFGGSNNNVDYHTKVIVSHYDRVNGSPGANDNSASVFVLLSFLAQKRFLFQKAHNVRIIFTDGEEAAGNVFSQGSYKLAEYFLKVNFPCDDVFVFDSIARGTTPVLQKIVLPTGIDASFAKKFTSLYERAKKIITAIDGYCMVLPCKYSDNAGFCTNGIPAVNITMLPHKEAVGFRSALKKYPQLGEFINNKKGNLCDAAIKMLPATWKKMHTINDTPDSLTADSIPVFVKALDLIFDLMVAR